MKTSVTLATLALTFFISGASFAAEKTVKLSVPGMSCPSCPYMVKDAVSMVDGVKTVKATMADRSATVTFDDAVTSVKEIQQATADIGYPSTLFKAGSGS